MMGQTIPPILCCTLTFQSFSADTSQSQHLAMQYKLMANNLQGKPTID